MLAVHPDWAGPYRSAGTASGSSSWTLSPRTYTEVLADDQAQQWADLFLGEDLYDVMDAVELASTITSARAPPSQALAVAVAVTFGQIRQRGGLALAAGWVADGAARLVADHGDTVVGTLLAEAPARDLRLLDAAAAAGRVPSSATAIRLALLRTEMAAAEKGAAAREERLAPLPGAASARTGGASADTGDGTGADMVINALGTASNESVDALLKVAWRHRISVPVAAWADRAEAFAAWWATRPDLPCDPARWPDQTGMLRLLRDQLSSQLSPSSDRRAAAAGAVRRNFWRLLLEGAVDPDQVLDAVVMTAAMAAADEATREALIQRVMRDAAGSSAPRRRRRPGLPGLVGAACPGCRRGPHRPQADSGQHPDVPVLTDAVQKAIAAGWRQGNLTDALDAARILTSSARWTCREAWRELSQEDRRLRGLCAALANEAARPGTS